jgi:hypothetical protein
MQVQPALSKTQEADRLAPYKSIRPAFSIADCIFGKLAQCAHDHSTTSSARAGINGAR